MGSLPAPYTLRMATPDDAPVIAHHRRAMFEAMGNTDQDALAAMEANAIPWAHQRLECGEFMTWLAVAPDGRIAAGAGLWIVDWLPTPLEIAGSRRGYLLNVYTEPAHRRKGLARVLVQTAIDYSREHGYSMVYLHASADGRPLYKALGFKATNEMRLRFDR